jgi:2-dehydropantoate 2-reductase
MFEVIAGGRACGAFLSDDMIEINLARTREMGPYRTSMQIDRQMGRELEIEAILHQPLEAAKAHGLDIPNLQNLYDRARMIAMQNMHK